MIASTVLRSAMLLTLLVFAYSLTPTDGSRPASVAVRVAAALLIVVVATGFSIRSVARAQFPILRALETIVLVVGLLIIAFAAVYLAASSSDSDAFSEPLDHTGAIYFALTTATTVGFGDITPRSNPARIAVMVQMVGNVIVLGVATRLLLGTAQRRSRHSE